MLNRLQDSQRPSRVGARLSKLDKRLKKRLIFSVTAIFCTLAVHVLAEDSTTNFTCSYTKYATKDGLKAAEADFVLRFLIDGKLNKAYLIGNAGSSEVKVVSGDRSVSFIEITGVGNVVTTTFDETGTSVHSRNSVIDGDLIASQYYGLCE